MGRDICRSLDPPDSFSRICTRIQSEAASGKGIYKCHKFSFARPATGGSSSFRQRGIGTCSNFTEGTGHLCPCISERKEVWGSKTYSKFKTIESLVRKETFQNGQSRVDTEKLRTQSVGNLCGFERRLSSCTTKRQTSAVHATGSGRPPFPVYMSLFWSGASTQSIYKDNGCSRGISEKERPQNIHVLRRLVDCSKRKETIVGTTTTLATNSGKTRAGCEQREINVRTKPESYLPGNKSVSEGRRSWSDGRSYREDQSASPKVAREKGLPGKGIFNPAGNAYLLHRDSPLGSTSSKTDSALPVGLVETTVKGPVCKGSNLTRDKTTFTLVDQSEQFAETLEYSRRGSTGDSLHGCQPLGVGRIPRRVSSHCTRPVVKDAAIIAHKYAGDEVSVPVPAEIRETNLRQKNSGEVRQFHSRDLLEQAGRNEIPQVVLSNMGDNALVHFQRDTTESCSPTGSKQQTCRFTQQKAHKSCRMGTSWRNTEDSVPDEFQANDRLVRFEDECKIANVLHMERRAVRFENGCAPDGLVNDGRLRVPSNCLDSTHITQNKEATLSHSASSSKMGEASVVFRVTEPIIHDPNSVTRSPAVIDSTERLHCASKSSNAEPGSLAHIRDSLRSQGFSEEAALLMSKSVRLSTHRLYKSRYREYVRWCRKGTLDPISAPIVEIANFLAEKFHEGLSYSTLCGYRSAISAYHDYVDGRKAGEHPKLVKLLKGVFNCRTPKKLPPPEWSLDKVLRSLRRLPYEPLKEASLKWLTLKTVFLVGICSASRSSDLARFGFSDLYLKFVNSSEGVRLTPRLLKKQCRPTHFRSESYIARFDDPKLDPVRALKIYLERVKGKRKQDGLFMVYGKGKRAGMNASSQTISKWMVEVISKAEPKLTNIRAHSTRAMATSVAFAQGECLEKIMKTADWSSDNVFAKHYLQEKLSREGSFTKAVLSTGKKKKH